MPTRRVVFQTGLAAAALFAAGVTPALAAAEIFLKLRDVVGESRESGRGGWIEVTSLSPTINPSALPRGAGSIRITKRVDGASAKIAQYAINGNSPGAADLDIAGTGKGSTAYLKYTLRNVKIVSYSVSGSGTTETFTLTYERIDRTG